MSTANVAPRAGIRGGAMLGIWSRSESGTTTWTSHRLRTAIAMANPSHPSTRTLADWDVSQLIGECIRAWNLTRHAWAATHGCLAGEEGFEPSIP